MADTLYLMARKWFRGSTTRSPPAVERFFGAMHSQFQAELPGYLPWGGIHNEPDAFNQQ
jgi:hypothetical protein